jgi:hypothetical protein
VIEKMAEKNKKRETELPPLRQGQVQKVRAHDARPVLTEAEETRSQLPPLRQGQWQRTPKVRKRSKVNRSTSR